MYVCTYIHINLLLSTIVTLAVQEPLCPGNTAMTKKNSFTSAIESFIVFIGMVSLLYPAENTA